MFLLHLFKKIITFETEEDWNPNIKPTFQISYADFRIEPFSKKKEIEFTSNSNSKNKFVILFENIEQLNEWYTEIKRLRALIMMKSNYVL